MNREIKLEFAHYGEFNKYYYCPVCGEDISELGISQHIIAMAKSELWKREIFKQKKTPHLDIVKKFGKIRNKRIVVLVIKYETNPK